MNLHHEHPDEPFIVNKAATSDDSQTNNRSSHSQIFFKVNVLKNFANFTGKHLCWSLFFFLTTCNFIKDRLQHRCFPVKFLKFLRTPFYIEHLQRLLLNKLI